MTDPTPSRWRKGTTTFGPVGRVSWTIGVLALPLYCLSFGGVGGIVFVLLWCTVVAPMALRDLWKADTPMCRVSSGSSPHRHRWRTTAAGCRR